jgi:hypothetical protein
MDLKALLKKTESKNKRFEPPQVKPFSIAMDDRPYDELLPKDALNKKTFDKSEKIEEPSIELLVKENIVEVTTMTPDTDQIFGPVPVIEAIQQKVVELKKEVKQEVKVKKTELAQVEIKKPIPQQNRAQAKTAPKVKEKIVPAIKEFKEYKELPPSIQEIEALATNISVNENPLLEEPGTAFLLLSGCQKKIVDYFFELSIKHNSSKIGPITTDTITITLEISSETFRKSIQRLKSKGIIYTCLSKEGRGGWSIYEFNSAFYQELISSARLKSGFKFESPSVTSAPGLVPQSKVGDLPVIWSRLEYQDLAEYGFNKNHLIQIYKDQEKAAAILDLDSMQYALDAFKFDMENNSQTFKEKIRTQSPTAFLINILSKGRPYNSFTPEKFKTPEQIAMLQYKEKKEQISKELQSLKDTYFETEFQSWYDSLTEQDADELLLHLNVKLDGVPQNFRIIYKMRSFKEHFTQVIWQDVVKQLRKKI